MGLRRSFKPTNLVANGNFANGTTGWNNTNSTLSVTNNICTVTGTGGNASVYIQREDLGAVTVTNKYYTRAKVKVTNNVCGGFTLFYDGSTAGTNLAVTTILTPTQDVEYILSGVSTPPADATGNFKILIRHYYADAATASDKVMKIQEVLSIDLTSLLSTDLLALSDADLKIWCDNNLFAWFNSTMSRSKMSETGGLK